MSEQQYKPTYDTTIRTVTVAEQQLTQHTDWIDWSYDFHNPEHTNCMCCTPERRREYVAEQMARLRVIEDAVKSGKRIRASDYGGWPRIWKPVIGVGMVSKWPYWTPRPYVIVTNVLGTDYIDWNSLTGVDGDGIDDEEITAAARIALATKPQESPQ